MAATELSKYIGKELKALRIKNNLTQTELAEKAGIFWNAYAKIEQGKQEPKLETLEKILKGSIKLGLAPQNKACKRSLIQLLPPLMAATVCYEHSAATLQANHKA